MTLPTMFQIPPPKKKVKKKSKKKKTHYAEYAEHTDHMNTHNLPATLSFYAIICMKRIMGR
jgi:CRISPR/Cas system CMR-associated protein Cmr5 small subunit